ncbi:LPXTG cell wall anchor domain-containing protein, partial [uncultured Gemella sp.]|uniref:LPXTG cell wall anchor domain-containing protein n=1 Tax=uncultured Gemella sp. TaxID=254352 RepID=UPI0028EEC9AF
KTSFKDKEGNEIPKYPSEPGTVDKKDIPEYRFVETKKLPNGDTEHIYEKVTTPIVEKVLTTFVDEKGELIIPDENGSHPGRPLSGYEIVRTEKDEKGNIRNVYRKVTTPVVDKTTTWTDENGNPLKPLEKGRLEAGKVPGYEYVRTVEDKDGNVRHIFRKVTPKTPEVPSETTVQPKAQVKRLANTGSETTNTAVAGFGVLLAGIAAAVRKRKKED